MYWGAYEPRVGLTWKVLGSDKTVLRLGFGIYHDSSWNQGAQGLWQNPPNLGESDQFPYVFTAAPLRLLTAPPRSARVELHHSTGFPPSHSANCGQLTGHVQLPAAELPAGQGSPI